MKTHIREDLRDTAITVAGTSLIFIANLVAGIVLSRVLGPDGKGQLAQLAIWASFAVDVLLFGTPGATTYAVARWPNHRRNLFSTIAKRLIFQALLGVILFLILTFTGNAAEELPLVAIVAYAAWVAAAMAVELATGYLQGRSDFVRFNWVRIASQASPVLLLVIIAAVGALTVSTGAIIYAVAVTGAASVGLFWTHHDARKPTGDSTGDNIAFSEVLALSGSFAKREYASTLATKSNRSIDLLVVSLLPVSAASIGVYSVAASASGAIAFVGLSIGMVAFSRSARTSSEPAEVRALVVSGCILTVLAAAVLNWTAPTLIPLIYGSEFAESVPLVRILVFGAAAISIGHVLAGVLRGRGRPGSVAIAEAAGAATTGASILLLGTAQIDHVAYSAVVGFVVTLGIEVALLAWSSPFPGYQGSA